MKIYSVDPEYRKKFRARKILFSLLLILGCSGIGYLIGFSNLIGILLFVLAPFLIISIGANFAYKRFGNKSRLSYMLVCLLIGISFGLVPIVSTPFFEPITVEKWPILLKTSAAIGLFAFFFSLVFTPVWTWAAKYIKPNWANGINQLSEEKKKDA